MDVWTERQTDSKKTRLNDDRETDRLTNRGTDRKTYTN